MVYSNIRKYINDNTELYGGIFLKKIIGLALLSAAAGLCIAALKKKEEQEAAFMFKADLFQKSNSCCKFWYQL